MRWAAGLFVAMLAPAIAVAGTDAERPEALMSRAVEAVQRGALDEGVDALELLSDRGFVHPDASAARAFAYIERARSRSARPGDLGRAAAALEEAHLLRPGDAEVETALEKLDAEIARRRARAGGSPFAQRPTLGRAIVGLLPEDVWAMLAIVGGTALTLGLVVIQTVRRRGAEIAAAVGIVAGLVLALIGGGLTAAARQYRTSSRPAVVVVTEARLLDADGRPLRVRAGADDVLPEGALVYVREQRAGRSRVEWGSVQAWVHSAELRVLAITR